MNQQPPGVSIVCAGLNASIIHHSYPRRNR
jgi:hypothetical protein